MSYIRSGIKENCWAALLQILDCGGLPIVDIICNRTFADAMEPDK